MATKFLTPELFNRKADPNGVNCLGFALGQTKTEPNSPYSMYNLDYRDIDGAPLSIRQSFAYRAQYFKIPVKHVDSIVPGKVNFLVYGWFYGHDFHVVRVDPDGRLCEKPDWYLPARHISFKRLTEDYPEKPEVFVLDE